MFELTKRDWWILINNLHGWGPNIRTRWIDTICYPWRTRIKDFDDRDVNKRRKISLDYVKYVYGGVCRAVNGIDDRSITSWIMIFSRQIHVLFARINAQKSQRISVVEGTEDRRNAVIVELRAVVVEQPTIF